ncbi:MAG: hypothetical protein V4722_22795 [Bacteroidota bacterium]
MKRKYTLWMICLVMICFQSFAQDAKSSFSQASLAYEAGKYKEALFYLGETERALGKSNPKIQSLRTMCYYEQGDNENALLELTRYFKTTGSGMEGSEGYKEMQGLQKELLEGNKTAYEAQKRALENEKNQELNRISQQENSQVEENEYELVKESGSVKAMKAFISKYPSSSHNDQFRRKIAEINTSIDYNNLVLKGDQAMVAGKWDIARTSYTKANEIKKDNAVTAKINECDEAQYKELMIEGTFNADDQAWEKAIKNFRAAIAVKDRSDARSKLEHAMDNNAFIKAVKADEIGGYVKYLKDFDNPIYQNTAEDFIIGKTLDRADAEYKAGDPNAVESNLDAAYGYRTTRIWSHYESRYYEIMLKQAVQLTKGTKEQRINAVPQAIGLYEKLNNAFSPQYTGTIAKLKRRQKRWDRMDYFFAGWHADVDNLYGIMLGDLKNRKVGWYFSGRTGDGIFEDEAYWETDKTNSVTGSVDPRKTFTGAIKSKTIYGTIGITKKIVHPLWLYVGAGVCINSELRQFEHTQTNELEYAINKDAKYTAPNAEAGLYLKLGPIVLRYGVNRPITEKFTGTVIQHFGAAFSL